MGRRQQERLREVTAAARLAVRDGQPFNAAARTAGRQSASTVANLVGRFNHRGLPARHRGAGRGTQADLQQRRARPDRRHGAASS